MCMSREYVKVCAQQETGLYSVLCGGEKGIRHTFDEEITAHIAP